MNVGFYSVAFDKASNALLDILNLGKDCRCRTDASLFIVEAHLTYDQGMSKRAPLRFETQIVDAEEKRLHLIDTMDLDPEEYSRGNDGVYRASCRFDGTTGRCMSERNTSADSVDD